MSDFVSARALLRRDPGHRQLAREPPQDQARNRLQAGQAVSRQRHAAPREPRRERRLAAQLRGQPEGDGGRDEDAELDEERRGDIRREDPDRGQNLNVRRETNAGAPAPVPARQAAPARETEGVRTHEAAREEPARARKSSHQRASEIVEEGSRQSEAVRPAEAIQCTVPAELKALGICDLQGVDALDLLR